MDTIKVTENEPARIHLVMMSYMDYEDSFDSPVAAFSDLDTANEAANQYRQSIDLGGQHYVRAGRDPENVRFEVHTVSLDAPVVPFVRIHIGFGPETPKNVRVWDGSGVFLFNPISGYNFLDNMNYNLKPSKEDIHAAVERPDEVHSYAVTIGFLVPKKRGSHIDTMKVTMFLSMNKDALDKVLAGDYSSYII